jgi:hypothetical protein
LQTRRDSLIESLVNVGVGYVVAVISQIIIFPIVGVNATFSQNITIGIYFTIISLLRSYCIRRFFNQTKRRKK